MLKTVVGNRESWHGCCCHSSIDFSDAQELRVFGMLILARMLLAGGWKVSHLRSSCMKCVSVVGGGGLNAWGIWKVKKWIIEE